MVPLFDLVKKKSKKGKVHKTSVFKSSGFPSEVETPRILGCTRAQLIKRSEMM